MRTVVNSTSKFIELWTDPGALTNQLGGELDNPNFTGGRFLIFKKIENFFSTNETPGNLIYFFTTFRDLNRASALRQSKERSSTQTTEIRGSYCCIKNS